MAARQIHASSKKFCLTFITLSAALYIAVNYNESLESIWKRFAYLAALLSVTSLIFNHFQFSFWKEDEKIIIGNKAVLITGCDSGFGHRLAKRLAKVGFHVFAGCLNPEGGGAKELLESSDSEKLQIFKLNVSSPEDIALARDFVENTLGQNELWAVVNNAGITKGTEVEKTSIQHIEEVLDVNLTGVIRVTKAFLPLIKSSHGRIVNVSSVAGRVPFPAFAAYCLSKHAVISFTDCLRLEMHKCRVSVISIEPWVYRTRLAKLLTKHSISEYPSSSSRSEAEEHISKVQSNVEVWIKRLVNDNVDEVVDAMENAVTLSEPPCRYIPGKWYLQIVLWLLTIVFPDAIRDFILCSVTSC